MKTVELIDKAAVLEAAKKLDSYAWSDFAALVEGQPVIRLPEDALPGRPDDRDCIDLICKQIKKIQRHEGDDYDRYAIQLRDGKWVFTGMNEIVRRFIFDNRHCKRTQVSITGETEYLGAE